MLFHSYHFVLFFIGFIFIFAILKGQSRIFFTLVASFVFYSNWYLPYFFLLLFFIIFAYYGALITPQLSKFQFSLLIFLCLVPLLFFKYYVFFLNNVNALFHTHYAAYQHWQLPLGISFITFTVLSYLIDVRRRIYLPETNFQKVGLYISFFPHLIAGPIMRPRELFPQFSHLRINKKLVKLGLFLFAIGVVKKVIFADHLALSVDAAYREAVGGNAAQNIVAFYGFPVQIYCDFSGYTDMALGLAFLLGIRLPLNFRQPYFADSVRDFWHRWHMTLSRWLRDYLYIPLGGSRRGTFRTVYALMITMLLGGLWHGASWNFVIWGAYFGLLLILEYFMRGATIFSKIPAWIKIFITFHTVSIGWIFFRGRSFKQITAFVSDIVNGSLSLEAFQPLLFPILLVAIFFALHRWDRVSYICWLVRHQTSAFIYSVCAVVFFVCIVLATGNPSEFIYFDF